VVVIDKLKMGSLHELRNNWKDLTVFMCECYELFDNQKSDDTLKVQIKNPKNELQVLLKKFDLEYESYIKGKGILMDKDSGEPPTGGFA